MATPFLQGSIFLVSFLVEMMKIEYTLARVALKRESLDKFRLFNPGEKLSLFMP